MGPKERISLESVKVADYPDTYANLLNAHSRAKAVDWGFGLLAVTIAIGLTAFVALDMAKLETNTLREWLQTTIASEVGLLAGLLGARER